MKVSFLVLLCWFLFSSCCSLQYYKAWKAKLRYGPPRQLRKIDMKYILCSDLFVWLMRLTCFMCSIWLSASAAAFSLSKIWKNYIYFFSHYLSLQMAKKTMMLRAHFHLYPAGYMYRGNWNYGLSVHNMERSMLLFFRKWGIRCQKNIDTAWHGNNSVIELKEW